MEENSTNIKDRILQIPKTKGISVESFLSTVGQTYGNYKGKSKNSVPGADVIAEISSKYPDVNVNWLLTGRGAMYSNDGVSDVPVDYQAVEASVRHIPLIQQYAYAGYQRGFADPEYMEELPTIPWTVDKEYKGKYFAVEVKGDSMDDGTDQSIKDKDILICRDVKKEYWTKPLHIKDWDFVIVHREDGIVAKRIIEHKVAEGLITVHSLNDYYDDYVIDLRQVDQIMNIVEVKRSRQRK